MFLQQTMGPWFAIQRASQVTMILLAFAMLILPILHSPKDADAEVTSTGLVVAGLVIAGIGVAVAWITGQDPKCNTCGEKAGSPDSHRSVHDPCGTGYWTCDADSHRCTCSTCGRRQWCCDPHDHSSS